LCLEPICNVVMVDLCHSGYTCNTAGLDDSEKRDDNLTTNDVLNSL